MNEGFKRESNSIEFDDYLIEDMQTNEEIKPVWLMIDKQDKSIICVCLTTEDANEAVKEFGNIADLKMYFSYKYFYKEK